MDKKLFEELKEGLQQMADHAAGKKVEGVREITFDVAAQAIETEEENERALAIIERLMRKGEGSLSPDEDRFLRRLVALVEEFEEKAYPIGPSNPSVALRELMREHGLKQTDMVEIFGSQGTVSQVLNGKREISKSQAKKLSARFHLPVDIFI